MKLFSIIITIFFLALSNQTFACDCESKGNFLTVSPETNLVALVKVTKFLTFKAIYAKQIPLSMEVEIVRIFKGNETRKTVVVWGDNGILCRPYLSQFETNKYYIIGFINGSDGTKGYVHKDEKTTDYALSICGDFWLSADIEKKVASGSVSENLTSIRFDNLLEFYNGDKTNDLTPNDFKEIYQLALDLPKLQQYYHVDKDESRKQVFIKYFGEANHNNLSGVTKFEKQIKILSEKEIKDENIKNYFVLGDWVCGLNSVRMQLNYVGEGLTISYMFKKIDGHWKIINSELWEE